MSLSWIPLLGTAFILSACAISKPCQEGGDIHYGPPIKGNRQCAQKKGKDGSYRNDGKYIQWHPNGKIAVEGEFKEGKKEGLWTGYDDTGKKTSETFFIQGVETPRDTATPKPKD